MQSLKHAPNDDWKVVDSDDFETTYPFVVRIYIKVQTNSISRAYRVCTGTAIATNLVLTARHCFENMNFFHVVAGMLDHKPIVDEYDLTTGGNCNTEKPLRPYIIEDIEKEYHKRNRERSRDFKCILGNEKSLIHASKQYDPNTFKGDVSLIRLSVRLEKHQVFENMRIGRLNPRHAHNGLFALGYGDTDAPSDKTGLDRPNDEKINKLQIRRNVNNVRLVDRHCETKLVAKDVICSGDSGGPLFIGLTIYGISSSSTPIGLSRCKDSAIEDRFIQLFLYRNFIITHRDAAKRDAARAALDDDNNNKRSTYIPSFIFVYLRFVLRWLFP